MPADRTAARVAAKIHRIASEAVLTVAAKLQAVGAPRALIAVTLEELARLATEAAQRYRDPYAKDLER